MIVAKEHHIDSVKLFISFALAMGAMLLLLMEYTVFSWGTAFTLFQHWNLPFMIVLLSAFIGFMFLAYHILSVVWGD
jgi:hypothetical protein